MMNPNAMAMMNRMGRGIRPMSRKMLRGTTPRPVQTIVERPVPLVEVLAGGHYSFTELCSIVVGINYVLMEVEDDYKRMAEEYEDYDESFEDYFDDYDLSYAVKNACMVLRRAEDLNWCEEITRRLIIRGRQPKSMDEILMTVCYYE